MLLAILSPQDKQVKLVGLQLDDDLCDRTFEVQPSHQLAVVTFGELLLSKLHAHDRLQLVLDLSVGEYDVAIDDAELHSV